MKLRVISILINVLLMGLSMSLCQTSETPQTVRKGIIYKKERSFEVAIQTNGYFFGYNQGKISKYYLSKYLHFDLGHLKDPREQKINQANLPGNFIGNYIYGKQNDLWNLRVGRGINYYLSEKNRRRGIALALRAEGGLLIGLLKPYYLKVRERKDNESNVIELRYSDDRKEQFLAKENILGASSYFRGIEEISIKPGAFGRISLAFDPGAYEKLVRSISFGLSVDVFTGRVPLLVTDKNSFLFANFFLKLQFGKRN
ncbi:MAG: hypothetical protein HOP11_11580 [Saprospiraceae bacterium]|nr:hypothetical protein [Saprospiraceae bacterium]